MLFLMAILARLSRADKTQTHNLEKSMSSNEAIPTEKKTTAQELIAANIQALIEQLEAGKSDALTAYLDAITVLEQNARGRLRIYHRRHNPRRELADPWPGSTAL